MAVRLADDFLPGRVWAITRKIAHRAGRDKQRGFPAKHCRRPVRSRFSVLQKHIVPDLGLPWRAAHGRGRTGNGIGAKIGPLWQIILEAGSAKQDPAHFT
jgi:hypothetical protein